ncbi:nodulation protein NfeD [Desulfuromonas carbonis]|uniref:NfeD family protein n=1 Tax=Desulfuromonas sp. DDH964 TaxID=1823759 RepID=UPI00078C86CD|nr:nodulation protein NfeD [Desulfuromonas sp. DDH964]AMV71981.1 membrane-bound serine protease NfeD, long form [Desulfuromonas sp. DDH964]
MKVTISSIISILFLAVTAFPALAEPAPGAGSAWIAKIRIDGVINPVTASFTAASLAAANRDGAAAFLLQLNTPGGLDSAMRQIIQAEFASDIPVIVYVAPSGARAASAGALITLAADFAAMAPGTNIGAAHPVSIIPGGGGDDEVMKTKVVNDAVAYARSIASRHGRNLEWAEKVVRESLSAAAEEALELGVIDLIAPDEYSLLLRLDGRSYQRGDQSLVLHSKGARVETFAMDWRQEILDTLSNPTVAYLLLMLGILGIFFEISQPGVILPGAIGAIAILLALFSFQALPINFAGVLLIVLAVVLFLLEIKVTSFGMLTIGGVVALSLGSLMLIDSSAPYLQISRAVIAATVLVCSGFFALVVWFVVRTHRQHFVSGREGLVGERGVAVDSFSGSGRVFVHGEYWDAHCVEPLNAGDAIEVVRLEPGMRLEVRPAAMAGAPGTEPNT